MLKNYYDAFLAYLPYVCNAPCTIEFMGEGLNEDGGKKRLPKKTAKCIFQSEVSRSHDDKGVSTGASGACYIVGDILPEQELLEGKIEIDGISHTFNFKGKKWRDAERKVIYTELMLF